MGTQSERGMALVITLLLMSVLTALGTSLMFLSQTETYSTMNYRMMSQARYAAESGIQRASNFLLDSAQYTVPASSGTDLLSNYDRTVSPVTWGGQPVILSGDTTLQPANYPVTPVQTAFYNAFHGGTNGTLTAGNATLTYKAYAKLMAMQVFDTYGGGQAVVQTWEIVGIGGLTTSSNATVEVMATIETPKVPASSYAAFATDNTCGALNFDGDITINSYDSTNMSGSTTPTMSTTGGNVGTNGNLYIQGSVDVEGNLYTPRTGVGTCTSGAVNALTEIGHADVSGSIVQLPTAVSYPTPQVPAPSPIAEQSFTTTTGACAALGLTGSNCTTSGSDIIIDGHGTTLSLPSLRLGSHVNVVLVASNPSAQYNFNSIVLDGGSQISISATSPTQGVLVDVVGKNPDGSDIATAMDFQGGTFAAPTGCATCSNFDASMLQFVYAGSGEIDLYGNSGAAATFYAPNANIVYGGTADLYGSVLGRRIHNIGTGNIHYDRRLMHDFYVPGHPMMGTFSWKRFN